MKAKYFLICFLTWCFPAGAQDAVKYEVSYYKDLDSSLTIHQINTVQFENCESNTVSLGFVSYPVWVKVSFPEGFVHHSFLSIMYPLLDSVTLYYHTSSGWRSNLYGDAVKDDERPLKTANINFAVPQIKNLEEIYLRISTSSSMKVPIVVMDFENTLDRISIDQYANGVFYGAMLIMFFYNLILFFSVKEYSYLFYCGHILFYIISQFSFRGHLYQLLPFEIYSSTINIFLINSFSINVILVVLFTLTFLKIKKSSNKITYYYLWMNIFLSVAITFSELFLPYKFTIIICLLHVITLCFGLSVIGWESYYTGNRFARYYLSGWSFAFVSIVLLNLRTLGLFDAHFYMDYAHSFAIIIESVMLSFALADRFNYYKAERAKAKTEALAFAQEKEQFIKSQNIRLETEVQNRTKDLLEKQQQVEFQNEELTSQRELLKQLNQALEQKVLNQTEELQKNNKALATQNSSLQQFAYVVAHNIRSPIARMLGLTRLYDLEQDNREEQEKIMNMIKDSSVELDEVVTDFNKILEIKKTTDYSIVTVSIPKKLDKICTMLQNEIHKNGVSINRNVDIEEVQTIDPYLESILFNLISNAIKFSKKGNDSQVTISNYEKKGAIYFEVADNGRGIDMKLVQNKMFQLYQRFEINSQGKGMGLYIVKTQVEAIGGKVSCKSQLGKGTAFTFWIPKHNS